MRSKRSKMQGLIPVILLLTAGMALAEAKCRFTFQNGTQTENPGQCIASHIAYPCRTFQSGIYIVQEFSGDGEVKIFELYQASTDKVEFEYTHYSPFFRERVHVRMRESCDSYMQVQRRSINGFRNF